MVNNGVKELSKKEFEDFTKSGLVLIDFSAEWCMPCLMMAPVIDELNEKFKGKIKFGKIDVDENAELAQKFKVGSIPNFVLIKEGKVINQFVGAMSEEDFEAKLKKYLG